MISENMGCFESLESIIEELKRAMDESYGGCDDMDPLPRPPKKIGRPCPGHTAPIMHRRSGRGIYKYIRRMGNE